MRSGWGDVRRSKRGAWLCLAALLLATMLQAVPAGAAIDDDEEDFNLYGGVNDAIALAFDGEDIYVGERHGKLKHFTAPTTAPNGIAYDPKGVVDLSAKVFTRGGHGLTSIAYHHGFVYAVYSTNNPNTVEGCGERYGYPDGTGYPNTPGQFAQDKWASCPTYGQLSRWPVKGDGTFGEEEVVLAATAARWCAEFDAPSITDVFVGPDDEVYVAAADGAHFAYADTGQAHERARGSGERPCRGRGAFRAQTDDSLDGKIVRLDDDGPTVVARGLRNPWRHAVLGDKILSVDAGWDRYEEINLFDPTGEVENFGWPCTEGPEPQRDDYAGDPLCEDLEVTDPWFTYAHDPGVPTGISGLAVHDDRVYFADVGRRVIESLDLDGDDRRTVMTEVHASDLEPIPFGGLAYAEAIPGGDVTRVVDGEDGTAPAWRPSVGLVGPGPVYPGEELTVVARSTLFDNRDDSVEIVWDARLMPGGVELPVRQDPAKPYHAYIDTPAGLTGRPTVVVHLTVRAGPYVVTEEPHDIHLFGWDHAPEIVTGRIAGGDRIATAAEIARIGWGVSDTVFVARADAPADALAVGPAAAKKDAPLLLTHTERLPAETAEIIAELEPRSVVVVGGERAVSPEVVSELERIAPVTRIAGRDRYETSAKLFAYSEPENTDEVLLATGEEFADALVASFAAAKERAHVLLTRHDRVPAPVATALADARSGERHCTKCPPPLVLVVGGPAAVSDQVITDLRADHPGTYRLGGNDRYETAALLAYHYVGYLGASHATVASGVNFPDALTVAPFAARMNWPLLLTRPDRLPDVTAAMITDWSPYRVFVVGGPAAVSTDVEAALGRLRWR